jgi:ABC-type multidrug transport system ATPase subunit
MNVVVSIQGVEQRFGHQPPVLQDVSLELHEGEVLGLLGPNGGGKSTLLMLMAGLIAPTEGTVTVEGTPATDLALTNSGKVGLITAEPGLYPLLTGWENLHYFGGLFGLNRAEVERRAHPLLEELELDQASLALRSGGYSSGMRQKVSLARALLLEPRLLLLDEPTSNLDPLSTQTLHAAVRRHADRGVAVGLVTHDLFAASHICNRVALIGGRVLAEKTLEGARSIPDPGPLYHLYAETVGT